MAIKPALPATSTKALAHIFEDAHPANNKGRKLSASNDNADQPVDAVLSFLRGFAPLNSAMFDMLGPKAVAVRMVFLRAELEVHRRTSWFQDVSIVAKNAHPLPPGFGPLSITAGIPHITAPQEFLRTLLTARVYLDNTPADNGAWDISPGSHRKGRISQNVLQMMTDVTPLDPWPARSGDIHLFRPLLLRRPTFTKAQQTCRIVQIELAPHDRLPGNLAWHTAARLF